MSSAKAAVLHRKYSAGIGSGRGLARDRDWRRQKQAVSRDDFAVKKNQFARRMSGDGLGNTARRDGEQVGRGADGDAVIANAKSLCAGGADQLEGDLHLRV